MGTALITGITGQDGSYLAELLLEKGYIVHGVKRRSSSFNTMRIDHLFNSHYAAEGQFVLHHGDMTDASSLLHIMEKVEPNEIYNLAAQSHVAVSFEEPEYTANSDALGTLRMLEAMRTLKIEKTAKFYQASTSELYGLVQESPQTETTPFYPRSPYAVAKLYAHWITVNYRESYGLFACNGILFNHESPVRGETFVTRKITRGLCRIKVGLEESMGIGNLDALRDWGHARDYVEMQWLMLQQEDPEDFVIATGKQYSVRDFINATADCLNMKLDWRGQGANEKAYWLNRDTGDSSLPIIHIDQRYLRPAEVATLLGDATKAREKLGWKPKVTFDELVSEMVESDMTITKQEIKKCDY